MTYKAATGFFVGAVVTACTVAWGIGTEVRVLKDENHKQFSEISRDMSAIRENVAVIKVQVEGLSTAAVQPAGDIQQAQYVLVQLPPSDAELHDQRVRDILMLNQRGE